MPEPADPAPPLQVVVHIPKTAGSALNAALLEGFAAARGNPLWPVARAIVPQALRDNAVVARALSRQFAGGCTHVSRLAGRPALFDRLLAQSDWVSGHVTRTAMEGHLSGLGRTARWFTVLRDPVDQIASHYQWWIEIHDRGPLQFYRYGRFWRDLSRQIRATDNADPRAIIPILSLHQSLFLNIQWAYVRGPDSPPDARGMAAALAQFAAIGIDGDIAPVVRAMTGQVPGRPRSVNRSRSAFDRRVFRHPAMTEFLAEAHALDLRLVALARDSLSRQAPSS